MYIKHKTTVTSSICKYSENSRVMVCLPCEAAQLAAETATHEARLAVVIAPKCEITRVLWWIRQLGLRLKNVEKQHHVGPLS